jgi:hypothetical protein
MRSGALLGFPLAALRGRQRLSRPKPKPVLLRIELSLPPFVLLLLESSLALKLLHSVVMLHFPLPGYAIDLLRFLCLASLLPLFPQAPVTVITGGAATEYCQDYRYKHGFHGLVTCDQKARPRVPRY